MKIRRQRERMYNEFCEISGQEVSFKAYSEKFEPMYMALGMDKREFINFLMPTIKEVAKQERKVREAEERKNQKLVFVSDGTKTPNGAYFFGGFFKLVGCDIKTGKVIVRNLTDEEYNTEVSPYFSGYCHGTYDVHERNAKIVA